MYILYVQVLPPTEYTKPIPFSGFGGELEAESDLEAVVEAAVLGALVDVGVDALGDCLEWQHVTHCHIGFKTYCLMCYINMI